MLNYIRPEEKRELRRMDRMEAQLVFSWDETKGSYSVSVLIGGAVQLRCSPPPPPAGVLEVEPPPTHRFPSVATPSFFMDAPPVKTEDDIIYRPSLPDFRDKYGQVLNQRDSELLLSYLTVPYMRLPLLLTFFATEDRVHKLQSQDLRSILDSVMFEPSKYLQLQSESRPGNTTCDTFADSDSRNLFYPLLLSLHSTMPRLCIGVLAF